MIVSQKYQGNITIVAPAFFGDYLSLMRNPLPEEVNDKIDRAERETWKSKKERRKQKQKTKKNKNKNRKTKKQKQKNKKTKKTNKKTKLNKSF